MRKSENELTDLEREMRAHLRVEFRYEPDSVANHISLSVPHCVEVWEVLQAADQVGEFNPEDTTVRFSIV